MNLFSIAYLPPIDYIALCAMYKKISIEICENYTKQTYRNRAKIASANGLLDLIIPVELYSGKKTNIRDVKISYAEPWHLTHWNALISAYGSAPYFEFYIHRFRKFYASHYTYLFDFNEEILYTIFQILKLDIEINYTSEFVSTSQFPLKDYRIAIHPKKTPTASFAPYPQVFQEKHGFLPQVSIIDTILNLGPQTVTYLQGAV